MATKTELEPPKLQTGGSGVGIPRKPGVALPGAGDGETSGFDPFQRIPLPEDRQETVAHVGVSLGSALRRQRRREGFVLQYALAMPPIADVIIAQLPRGPVPEIAEAS